MSSQSGLTKEFLAERDLRIFKMRQAGVAVSEIGRRFNMSTKSVTSAINRQLQKLNQEALMGYPEVLRMELERLDALQQAIWPLTQHRKVRLDDGSEVSVEPDIKAIQQVLSIMDRRARLLGMEQQTVNLQVEQVGQADNARAILAGTNSQNPAAVNQFNPENEARQLLELMGASGVLPSDTVRELLGQPKELPSLAEIEAETADVIDVDDEETTYG
jgi:hypothetical protein